jgi:hypothetical protein
MVEKGTNFGSRADTIAPVERAGHSRDPECQDFAVDGGV